MKFKITIIILVGMLGSCKKGQDPVPSIYADCCSPSEQKVTVGTGNLYLGNYASPNNDAYADFMVVYYDAKIKELKNIKLYDRNDQLITSEIKTYPVPPYTGSYWYPGPNSTGVLNPSYGLIKYTFEAESIDGVKRSISGSFCSISCEAAKDSIANLSKCRTLEQFDGFKFDNTIQLDYCIW